MTNGNLPIVQRAIVIQSGGVFGAYDARILKALYEKIHQVDSDRSRKKKNNIISVWLEDIMI